MGLEAEHASTGSARAFRQYLGIRAAHENTDNTQDRSRTRDHRQYAGIRTVLGNTGGTWEFKQYLKTQAAHGNTGTGIQSA